MHSINDGSIFLTKKMPVHFIMFNFKVCTIQRMFFFLHKGHSEIYNREDMDNFVSFSCRNDNFLSIVKMAIFNISLCRRYFLSDASSSVGGWRETEESRRRLKGGGDRSTGQLSSTLKAIHYIKGGGDRSKGALH